MASEKPNPMKLYTDLDLRGNVLRRVHIETPEKPTDPTSKGYVDQQTILDTDWAKKFKKPLVNVGGLTTDTEVVDHHFKDILDQLLFPIIPPTYKESEIEVINEPIKVLLGIPGYHKVIANIITNDRTSAQSNITCQVIDSYGKETTSITDRKGAYHNIECTFPPVAVDISGNTQLQLEVMMSPGKSKVDNHGITSPNILFENSRKIVKKIDYRGVYPVFYSFTNTTDEDPINIHDFLSWENVYEKLSFFDPQNYNDGIGCSEIDWLIGTESPKSIILFVPLEVFEFTVNGDNILECCDTQSFEFLLPNTKDGQRVTYVALKFITGDQSYSTPKKFAIKFKSDGIAWKDKLIITDYIGSTNGHTIVDDNQIEYSHQNKLHVTNAAVENVPEKDTTVIHVHPENAPVDGGFYDE